MPGTTASEAPGVSMSFANNFWGKDDAGVDPLLDRMHNAKVTGDELKAFYSARSAIEEEYAKKLLSLARKPLGSCEAGTLRMSLDIVRGEVESMGKAHQNIAHQMRTELDEQLSAFAAGMKERRKIVQSGIEKLLKVKNQQTAVVNKTRDRYEQDCLKIKGYLAQGHMVMGHEERKNKAKLEKTQIQLSTTRNDYEGAVKVLEETTGRWNRDWKIACDKFQDLEEERIDFMKGSLWTFANIASTVCVSDDASCEKIRLSLEDCDVEKDILGFIKEASTGQEIPDPPRFIDFTRGDGSDAASEISEEDSYSVAQFQRAVNPAYRSSSPQPPAFGNGEEKNRTAEDEDNMVSSADVTPRKAPPSTAGRAAGRSSHPLNSMSMDDIPQVPHNEYPPDGMTQFCRPMAGSDLSSAVSSNRPESRDAHSDYSQTASFTSAEPSILESSSPIKQMSDLSVNSGPDQDLPKKRSGFFNNRSPFHRKSRDEKDQPVGRDAPAASNRNTWGPSSGRHYGFSNKSGGAEAPPRYSQEMSASPEPVDPRAKFQLNVGKNVFDVASPDVRRPIGQKQTGLGGESDPIAQALAELKNGSKEPVPRVSADRYHGLATPAPPDSGSRKPSGVPQAHSSTQMPDRTKNYGNGQTAANVPPSYDQPAKAPAPVSRLGAPQPAFTSRQMQQTTQRYQEQKNTMFSTGSRPGMQSAPGTARPSPQSRPGTSGQPYNRAASPTPMRSVSPRPGLGQSGPQIRATSPNPYGASRPRAHSNTPTRPRPDSYGGGGSPGNAMPRAVSPSPQYGRPVSRNGPPADMSLQLAPVPDPAAQGYGGPQPRGRMGASGAPRPVSQYGAPPVTTVGHPVADNRARSRSVVAGGRGGQQVTRDGRPIMHFSRAVYMYQAAIPEELSFAKDDMIAVLRHQDDGWWEAEVCSKPGRVGLVPSNYLAAP